MDENEFFREATLRVCGDLEIGQAMTSFLQYIQDFMPADRLFLEYYDKNERVMRTIADATPERGESIDLITPLSNEAIDFLKKKYKEGVPEPYYYEKPYEVSVARELLTFHDQEAESILVLPLGTPVLPVGIVTLVSTHAQYHEKHLDLMSVLKEPFQVAMSNAMKHRNELRLFDRDFFFEVTGRICGNLKIEEGLRDCIQYISQFMPSDRLYLQRYQNDLDSMHLIARADKERYEKMDKLVPFTEEAKKTLSELAQDWRRGKLPPILIINDPTDEPVTKCMLEALNEPISSALSLPLVIENTIIGTLVLLAEGTDRYTEEHAKLFTTLKLPFFVALSNTLKHREVIQLKDLLADDNRYLQRELRRISGDEIVGTNFGLKDTMHKVKQVAGLNSPVLLLGETGVGKDVIANAIHYSSKRKDGPFVSVNCGAIPEALIDSELFGHEKGAFTGALSQKRGRFERANHGTIFLDEIGELPLEAQVRLLKVLQDREIERVGGTETIHLDIRIIAATNRNLEEMIAAGQFREDLWFRLNVFPIIIPPLRERRSDIPDLLQHFINKKTKEMKLSGIPRVSPGATDLLMHYDWPGNVRELENVVERSIILYPSGPLTFEHLNLGNQSDLSEKHDKPDDELTLDALTSKYIRKALSKTNGKIHGKDGAAELLGINASTLRNRMIKLGIRFGNGKGTN
jgi:transcriptional regulator with GAF, ATPase, and Fis domain